MCWEIIRSEPKLTIESKRCCVVRRDAHVELHGSAFSCNVCGLLDKSFSYSDSSERSPNPNPMKPCFRKAIIWFRTRPHHRFADDESRDQRDEMTRCWVVFPYRLGHPHDELRSPSALLDGIESTKPW